MIYRCRECTLLRCDKEGDICQECAQNEDTVELPILEEGAIASWAYDMVYGPICK